MGPAAALLVALVADDGTALRSAADDSAPAQAMLYRGDWLEVRGEAPGFLKVWDHRHERPGQEHGAKRPVRLAARRRKDRRNSTRPRRASWRARHPATRCARRRSCRAD